jgi:YHS domain-containing protein
MTAARRRRKSTIGLAALGLGLIAGPPAGFGPAPVAAATERIVTDRHTGLALYGFDPVAYFTDVKPMVGRPELELSFAGAIWRFCNEGNRAAFVDNPDVYMPRFGGYDALAVARGVAVPGHPKFWLVAEERLYLFQTGEARDAFAGDPEKALSAAQAMWPQVLETLVP